MKKKFANTISTLDVDNALILRKELGAIEAKAKLSKVELSALKNIL